MKVTAENKTEVLNLLKTIIEVTFNPKEKIFNVEVNKVTDETKGNYIIDFGSSSYACDYKLRKSQEKKLNNNTYFECADDVETVVNNMKKLLINDDFYSINRINTSTIKIIHDINKMNVTSIN